MAVVRKSVLPLGKHKSPDGEIDVTPHRVRHYVETFGKIKAAHGDNFIGVPWSHDDGALPGSKHFLESRLNSGYCKDLLVGPDGGLDAVLDCPGLELKDGKLVGVAELPNGKKVTTAISNVSVGILPSWKDGKGTEYKDVIGHVALATMPVVGNQMGFTKLESAKGKFICLSTLTRLDTSDKPEEEPKTDDEAAAKLDETFDGKEEEKPAADMLSQVLALMQQCGVPLPEGTTPENFLERFLVALTVLSEKAKRADEMAALANEEKPEEEDGAVVENPPPAGGLMMSTLARVQADPIFKGLIDGELNRRTEARKAKIESFKKRGLPPHVAKRYETSVIRLSTIITKTGFRDDEIDRQLDLLDAVLPRDEKFAAHYLSTITPLTVKEQQPIVNRDEPKERPGVTVKMTDTQWEDHKQRMTRNGQQVPA